MKGNQDVRSLIEYKNTFVNIVTHLNCCNIQNYQMFGSKSLIVTIQKNEPSLMLGILLIEKKATRPLAAHTNISNMTCGWSAGPVLSFQTPDKLFHTTTVGVYGISVAGDLIYGQCDQF